jgi:hypothetical protein
VILFRNQHRVFRIMLHQTGMTFLRIVIPLWLIAGA